MARNVIRVGLLLLVFGLLMAATVQSLGADTVSVQGLLKTSDGVPLASASYNMRFSLFDVASAGSALWTEAHSGANNVAVTQGLFGVELGSVTMFPPDLFSAHADLWVEVAVDMNGDGTYEEVFGPRLKLGAAPYAHQAKKADAVTGAPKYDAVVAPSGGDYTTIQAALAANKKTIFVRNGTYVLSSDINITEDGTTIIGESREGVIIDCNDTAYGIKLLGGARYYDTGTVSIVSGSKIVTGNGTSWLGNVLAGDCIRLQFEWYEIQSVNSNTQLTIVETYRGPDIVSATGYYASTAMLSGVTLENFTVQRSNLADSGGIKLYYVRNSVIQNCAANNNTDAGIYILCAYQCKFNKNFVRSNSKSGIHLFIGSHNDFCENSCVNNGENGIYVSNMWNTFSGNICSHNKANGIHVYLTGQNTFCGNTCDYNEVYGIFISDDSAANTVTGNQCRDNDNSGILLSESYGNSINGNYCGGNAIYGIGLYLSYSNSVSGNTCIGNHSDGIRLNQSDTNTLGQNVALWNYAYGVNLVNSACDNNIVTGNQLNGNASGAGNDASGGDTIKANNYPSF